MKTELIIGGVVVIGLGVLGYVLRDKWMFWKKEDVVIPSGLLPMTFVPSDHSGDNEAEAEEEEEEEDQAERILHESYQSTAHILAEGVKEGKSAQELLETLQKSHRRQGRGVKAY